MTALDQQRGHLSAERGSMRGAGRMYPVIMIRGVYRSGVSRGCRWYCLPSSPETSSRYRVRRAVRAARQAIVLSLADWLQREVQS